MMNSFLKPSVALQTAMQGIGKETQLYPTHSFGEVLQTVQQLMEENTDAAGRFPNIRALRGISG